jgi:hypothetical protein
LVLSWSFWIFTLILKLRCYQLDRILLNPVVFACAYLIFCRFLFFFACIAHSVLILFYQFVCYCYSCIRLLYGAAAQTYFCPFIEDFARWFLRDFLFEFDDLLVFSFGSVILMMTSEFRSPTLILVDYDSDLGPLDL